jgi:acyl-CoA hydrolase/GNAT superfamily N-acetyltransferase
MEDWKARYAGKLTTATAAMHRIERGRSIFIGSGAAEPVALVEALVAEKAHFADNPIVHLLTLGPAPYVAEDCAGHFRHNAYFIGPNVRGAVRAGRADYTPVFLSQIPSLIRKRRLPVDVALVQTTPPDRFGYVNLGVSVDIVRAAIESARLVIAQVNPRMPTVPGAGFIPMDRVDALVDTDMPLIEVVPEPLDEVAREIGRNVASLIDDGCTVQMGIGMIPDATLAALDHHKDLGVWTEMFSDGVMPLIDNGNITGRNNPIHRGKVTSSFCFGSEALYRYVDGNPTFTFQTSDFVNHPLRVAQQHRMVAINSALQVDLTGQVCADSIGSKFYSGIGGQVDFIRGASMCPGGRPIIAIRSTAKGGELSRIVAQLDRGAGVVTSRGDVRFVVTEYGVADLQGHSVRERAMALISIAHPDFRAELLEDAKAKRYVFADQISPPRTYPMERTPFTTADGRDGEIRPLHVTDEAGMTALFYRLSEDTKYRRFMQVLQEMPHAEVQKYLDVDYRDRMALVFTTAAAEQEPEIVAVARYEREPGSREADVAFVVRDDFQRQGISTALLAHLIRAARARGIEAFTATVLADNFAMMGVFHRSGLRVSSVLEDGVYQVHMALGPVQRDAARA